MTQVTAALLGAAIGGAAAVVGSLITALLAQRETQRSRAQDALDWMTGESQRRNVGIAVMEASWEPRWRSKRFRRLTTSVLCGTALYLISFSDQKDAPHELYNLDRIMALLLSHSGAKQFSAGYGEVLWAINQSKEKYGALSTEERRKLKNTGLFVDGEKLNSWSDQLLKTGASAAVHDEFPISV